MYIDEKYNFLEKSSSGENINYTTYPTSGLIGFKQAEP
jgi:hypothetical protein